MMDEEEVCRGRNMDETQDDRKPAAGTMFVDEREYRHGGEINDEISNGGNNSNFFVVTGHGDTWDCLCGDKIANVQTRCGNCHRWKDGKHPLSASKARKKEIAAKEGDGVHGESNHLAVAADTPSDNTTHKSGKSLALTRVPPDSGFVISSVPRRNEKGRLLCKIIGCNKLDQFKNDGFCRMHFNMFAIPVEAADISHDSAREDCALTQISMSDVALNDLAAVVDAPSGTTSRRKSGKALAHVPPHFGIQISSVLRRNEKGRLLCKVMDCTKLDQFKNDGFCRTHFKMFATAAEGDRIPSSANNPRRCNFHGDKFDDSRLDVANYSAAAVRRKLALLTRVPPESGVQISSVPRRNEKGRLLCKVMDCPKLDQSNNDGFCRMHFNMFAISAERDNSQTSWTCDCGQLISATQKRCGSCNKWKGGKRELFIISKKRKISEGNDVIGHWKCDCGNEVHSSKARCGSCHHWRGGKRQCNWKMRTECDDGIDRTKDWMCCGMVIKARQTRCGKCNGWRGGRRIASKGLPDSQVPSDRSLWECRQCGFSNDGPKRRCGRCRIWKGQSIGSPHKTKTDDEIETNGISSIDSALHMSEQRVPQALSNRSLWECRKCGFSNYGPKRRCGGCGIWKGESMGSPRQTEKDNETEASGALSIDSAIQLGELNDAQIHS